MGDVARRRNAIADANLSTDCQRAALRANAGAENRRISVEGGLRLG